MKPCCLDVTEEITQVLSRLTEPTVAYTLPSLGTVVTRATKKLQIREEEAPIPGEMLNEILTVRTQRHFTYSSWNHIGKK